MEVACKSHSWSLIIHLIWNDMHVVWNSLDGGEGWEELSPFVSILWARRFSFILYNALTRAALVAPPLSFTPSLKLSHKYNMVILRWLALCSSSSICLRVEKLSPSWRPRLLQSVSTSNSLKTITKCSLESKIGREGEKFEQQTKDNYYITHSPRGPSGSASATIIFRGTEPEWN